MTWRRWVDGVWIWWLGLLVGIASGWMLNILTSRRRRATWVIGIVLVIGTVALFVAPPILDRVQTAYLEHRPVRLEVILRVRRDGENLWRLNTLAKPGDEVEYELMIRNAGPGLAKHLIAGVNLARHLSYVTRTAQLRNGNNPTGADIFDRRGGGGGRALLNGGVDVGNYLPGANVYVTWAMRIDASAKAGANLQSVGIGRAPGKTNEIYNLATVQIIP
jgi:hypothetical protein